MHQKRITARQEDRQATESFHERIGTEAELRHGAGPAVRRRCANGVVDHVSPAGEVWRLYPIQAPFVRCLELRTLPADGQCSVERLEQRVRVEVDFVGHRFQPGGFPRSLVHRLHRIVGIDRGLSSCFADAGIEFRLDRGRVLAANESAVGGAVEDLVQGAQILADFVGLPDDVIEELEVRDRFADEVVHGDIAALSVAIQAPVPLFQAGGIPWAVVVQQVTGVG